MPMPNRAVNLPCGCGVEEQRQGGFLIAWCDEHLALADASADEQRAFALRAFGVDPARITHARERLEYTPATDAPDPNRGLLGRIAR